MKYGFMGYGNMGSIVVRTLLRDGSLEQGQIVVYNRTKERLRSLMDEYPDVRMAASPGEAASLCGVLFLCVRSGAVPAAMKEMSSSLRPDSHLITINGGVTIGNLEAAFPGAVSKLIPSVTLETGRGITLVRHGERVTGDQRAAISALFGRSSLVREVREEQFEAASDLTSCAPGLMAEMMLQFAEAGARRGGLPREAALEMVLETMMGTAILLADLSVTPDELKARVATKGGITEQGLRVLDMDLPGTYDRVFNATLEKHDEVKRKINEDFEHLC